MTLDLAQFNEAFFEESFEAIDSMEAALLALDPGVPDPESINTIFRVAHSIKGGAAMFGFKEVASFTHSLETLLDELRAGRIAVDDTIADILLKSVDVLRALLAATQQGGPIDMQQAADLQFDIESIIARRPGAPCADEAGPEPLVADAAAQRPAFANRWHIRFAPAAGFMLAGHDPLILIEQLETLGLPRVEADLRALPSFGEFDPTHSFLSWQIELDSNATREEVAGIFDWAEDSCELSIDAAGAPGGRGEPETIRPDASVETGRLVTRHAPEPDRAGAGEPPKPAGVDANSIRVSAAKVDALINTVGEIVITQAMLAELGARAQGPVAEDLRTGLGQLERSVRELHEAVMRVRMLPISFAFNRFPRLVRDLSHRLGKKIELRTSGEQTEIDKTVLERIGDPLVHLVRNCIDHGIELPGDRVSAGKPATGTITLEAYHRGSAIIIEVGDDGRGLDQERILAKARNRGLIPAGDTPGIEEIIDLIFLPGFSTADRATDLSGRGVGMDVVRRNIKDLGGSIEVSSDAGAGTRFTIRLPLTLAIVDGQTVAVGKETYIVPLVSIIESLQLRARDVNRLSGFGDVFWFRGDYLPILRLHELFGVTPRHHEISDGLVVVAEGDGRRVGLFVDELLGQQQVVIKSLENNYGTVDGVSGATILGDGSVALILDLPGLIRHGAPRAAA
jgi:two-component system chemotaxis sensor kinase CheA